MTEQTKRRAPQSIKWRPVATVEKYDSNHNLFETVRCEGNELTNAGVARLTELVIGETGTEALDASHCRLGVGDSDAAFDPTDNSLGANEFYEVMVSGYPNIESNQILWRVEYGDTDANFTWASWGLDVDDAGSVTAGATPVELFNRRVFNFGTKSGGTWALTVTVEFAQNEGES